MGLLDRLKYQRLRNMVNYSLNIKKKDLKLLLELDKKKWEKVLKHI